MTILESLSQARCAKWWGLMPWDFRMLGPQERAELMAIHDTELMIEAYYESEKLRLVESQ